MPKTRPRTRTAGRRPVRISDPRAELAALHDIGAALSAAWDLDTTLHKITETTAAVMRMDSCSIYLLDRKQDALVLKASTGLSPKAFDVGKLKIGEGITGYAAQIGKPVASRDAARDPHFKYVPGTEEQQFKSLAAAPLISQGTLIGAINVQTRRYHDYSDAELELLSLVGELAAGALERAQLHDDLQRQIQELSTLAQVSQTITAPIYLDEMLEVICKMAAQIMGARACALLLFDPEQDELALRAAYGLTRAHAAISPIDVETSLTGRAIRTGEPVTVPNLQIEPLYKNRELAKREKLYSFLSMPVRVRGKVIGAFNCYLGSVHTFTQKEIELFSTLANQTALALENANLAMNAMLVREMHHRIKNNLQMVAMLLRLQLREARSFSPPSQSLAGATEGQSQRARAIAPQDALQQTINRILSIAAVHEALSQEGFRLIGVKGLIQQAAFVATQNMVEPGKDIRVVIEGADIRLPSQPATTLAIAVNELIQNALEHGFDGAKQGTVRVTLAATRDRYTVRVEDNGAGLARGARERQSLGLQIVESLVVEDLRGEFKLANRRGKRGTVAVVRVPRRGADAIARPSY